MNNFSIDDAIVYHEGFKSGCEYMQEKYYKLLKPLYEECVNLENEILDKINNAPNNELQTPFILRLEWHTTLRERTAFREILESIIAKGALECLTAK